MRRGIIGLAVGVCVLSATGVAQAQVTTGFANFTDAFTLAYGFQFPNVVSGNSLAFSRQAEANNMAIQRQGSFERQQGAVGEEELFQIPGFEDLDSMSLSERERFGSRSRGVFKGSHRLKTLTAAVQRRARTVLQSKHPELLPRCRRRLASKS